MKNIALVHDTKVTEHKHPVLLVMCKKCHGYTMHNHGEASAPNYFSIQLHDIQQP
jgi:hypothetical protein